MRSVRRSDHCLTPPNLSFVDRIQVEFHLRIDFAGCRNPATGFVLQLSREWIRRFVCWDFEPSFEQQYGKPESSQVCDPWWTLATRGGSTVTEICDKV